MSISFLFDKNRDFASAGLGGATVGGARFVRYRAARSDAERAAPSVAFRDTRQKRGRVLDFNICYVRLIIRTPLALKIALAMAALGGTV